MDPGIALHKWQTFYVTAYWGIIAHIRDFMCSWIIHHPYWIGSNFHGLNELWKLFPTQVLSVRLNLKNIAKLLLKALSKIKKKTKVVAFPGFNNILKEPMSNKMTEKKITKQKGKNLQEL